MNDASTTSISVAILSVFVVGFIVGFTAGRDCGHRQMFNGSYACMKLPDNTTYCYKVEQK